MVSIILPSLRLEATEILREKIAKCTKDYELIITTELGGVNRAAQNALHSAKGDYILLICDDMEPTEGWVGTMKDFIGDKFAIGNFRALDDWENLLPVEKYYNKVYSWFPFISRESLEKLGGVLLDTRYKSFYGDPDLSLRMWWAGGEVLTCNDARIKLCGIYDDLKKDNAEKYEEEDKQTFIERWTPVYGEFTWVQSG